MFKIFVNWCFVLRRHLNIGLPEGLKVKRVYELIFMQFSKRLNVKYVSVIWISFPIFIDNSFDAIKLKKNQSNKR